MDVGSNTLFCRALTQKIILYVNRLQVDRYKLIQRTIIHRIWIGGVTKSQAIMALDHDISTSSQHRCRQGRHDLRA